MQLYGGEFQNFPEGYPRENYDTFLSSMLSWFTITTSESWVDQMWNVMRPEITHRFEIYPSKSHAIHTIVCNIITQVNKTLHIPPYDD
jgi:protein gp37